MNSPCVVLISLFGLIEAFGALLFIFGAPAIVYFPVILFMPLVFIIAAIKVTIEERREKNRGKIH